MHCHERTWTLRLPLDPVFAVLQRGRLSISSLPFMPNSEPGVPTEWADGPTPRAFHAHVSGLTIIVTNTPKFGYPLHSQAVPFSLHTSTRFAFRQHRSFPSWSNPFQNREEDLWMYTLFRVIHQWREASVTARTFHSLIRVSDSTARPPSNIYSRFKAACTVPETFPMSCCYVRKVWIPVYTNRTFNDTRYLHIG